jgi:hypothetical protein
MNEVRREGMGVQAVQQRTTQRSMRRGYPDVQHDRSCGHMGTGEAAESGNGVEARKAGGREPEVRTCLVRMGQLRHNRKRLLVMRCSTS